MGGSVRDVKSKGELDEVVGGGSPVVLHFWASWCEASKHMDQLFSHLATDFPHTHFLRVSFFLLHILFFFLLVFYFIFINQHSIFCRSKLKNNPKYPKLILFLLFLFLSSSRYAYLLIFFFNPHSSVVINCNLC